VKGLLKVASLHAEWTSDVVKSQALSVLSRILT